MFIGNLSLKSGASDGTIKSEDKSILTPLISHANLQTSRIIPAWGMPASGGWILIARDLDASPAEFYRIMLPINAGQSLYPIF
jgi:hypothetical protein